MDGRRTLVVEVVVMAAGLAVASLACSSSGEKYTVGGSSHWTIPPTPDFYTNWSSAYFFKTGDSLYFDFQSDRCNVIQVSRQEYDSCTACNPFRVFPNSPAIFPLEKKGIFYFISNISNYCDLGLKVSVTVHKCFAKPTPLTPPPPPPPPPSIPIPPSLPPGSAAPSPGGRSEAPTSTIISPAPSPLVNGYSPEAGDPEAKSTAFMQRMRLGTVSMNGLLISLVLQLSLMISVILA